MLNSVPFASMLKITLKQTENKHVQERSLPCSGQNKLCFLIISFSHIVSGLLAVPLQITDNKKFSTSAEATVLSKQSNPGVGCNIEQQLPRC